MTVSPGTRDVVDLASLCRHGDLTAFKVKGHAFFAAGEKQVFEVEFGAQPLSLDSEFIFTLPSPDNLSELRSVGCEQRCAVVARIVVAFWVDENRNAGFAGHGNHCDDVRKAALPVIGENQGIVFGEQGAKYVEMLVESLFRRM